MNRKQKTKNKERYTKRARGCLFSVSCSLFTVFCSLFLVTGALIAVPVALAETGPVGETTINDEFSILPRADNAADPGTLERCLADGNCSLCNMMQVGTRLVAVILSLTGAAVLVMLLYGGFRWLAAAGNEKWITAGKDTMKNAAIGLAIVAGAWMLVNLIITTLGSGVLPGDATGTLKQEQGFSLWNEIECKP